MMKRLLYLLIILLLFNSTNNLTGQVRLAEDFFIFGGYIGSNYNIHNADFTRLPGIPNCCPNFSNGTGFGLNGGVLAGYAVTERINIISTLGFVSMSGILKTEQMVPFVSNDAISLARIGHSIDTKLNCLIWGAGMEYEFTAKLSGIIKFNLANIILYDFVQEERLLSPEGLVFENGQRVRNRVQGKIPEINKIQYSISLGIRYYIRISNRLHLGPELYYSFALSDLVNNTKWKISSSHLLLNLVYLPDRIFSTPIDPER